jgi:hypothetical protein
MIGATGDTFSVMFFVELPYLLTMFFVTNLTKKRSDVVTIDVQGHLTVEETECTVSIDC